MLEVIRDSWFQRASLATAARVIELLKVDEAAYGETPHQQPPRLAAAERRERMRQRTTTR
jgi:hypothetical protein